MSRKPKFNPEITRIKLNPEQAVLACDCYSDGWKSGGGGGGWKTICNMPQRTTGQDRKTDAGVTSS